MSDSTQQQEGSNGGSSSTTNDKGTWCFSEEILSRVKSFMAQAQPSEQDQMRKTTLQRPGLVRRNSTLALLEEVYNDQERTLDVVLDSKDASEREDEARSLLTKSFDTVKQRLESCRQRPTAAKRREWESILEEMLVADLSEYQNLYGYIPDVGSGPSSADTSV